MPGQSLVPREFAREHHVHYTVAPEEVVDGGERRTVGFDVRLFASHEREPLGTPGCARCVELLDGLRAFAEETVRKAPGGAAPVQIVSEPSALYQSPEDAAKDEVALTIRVGPLPAGAHEDDPAIAALRRELEASGVARQG